MTKTWGPNIFVWLPAVSTDPNAGPTGGVLPVLVLADPESHHIQHLLAPSYTYNPLFGTTGTMRYYWYPTDTSQFVTLGSYSEHTNRKIKVRYENPSLFDGGLYLRTEWHHDVDGSRRFFGIGPQTHAGDESGYTSKDSVGRVDAGFNFFHSWRATFGERFRRMEIEQNIIPNVADLATRFPGLPGIGPRNTVASEFRLLWDTRDLPITPSRGSSGELFVEKTSVALGSDSDYIRYGLEGKRFFLWGNPNHVTVVHGLYEWVNGPNIPFYELPSLGGRETLRGYGEGRLADRGRMVLNLEHRITFASLTMMGIQSNFEFAPFFDIGSVFPTLPEVQSKNFRPVYGGAFRVAVKPNVVGDVEVGVGKEGAAVFVDIDYPF
jgi:outer membrane protein assembly factor BamA